MLVLSSTDHSLARVLEMVQQFKTKLDQILNEL